MYFYVIPAVRSAGLQGVELILGAKLGGLGSKRAAGRCWAAAVGLHLETPGTPHFPLSDGQKPLEIPSPSLCSGSVFFPQFLGLGDRAK